MSTATASQERSAGVRIQVAAVAGRRIDAPNAPESAFPERFVPRVSAEIARLLAARSIGKVVASAACGADILALEAALELGARIRIVLPFERERFRETSVVDRGGDWGARYDRVLDAAQAQGDVVTLEPAEGGDDAAYGRATARIIEEAQRLARESKGAALAIAIWNEKPRASADATQDFLTLAARAGMETLAVPTR
jgi:hypothetical protein